MIPAETLRDLYVTQQLSVRQIGDLHNTKHETIRVWLKRAGIETRSKAEGKMLRSVYKNLWTPERDQIIRDMWAEHKGCAAIARKIGMGVTKCAVLGRARRIGLPPHPKRPLSMTPDAIRKREDTKRKNRETMGQQLPLQAKTAAERFPQYSLISFEPHRRLQTLWLTALAEVRAQRAAAWRTICGVTR